MRRLFSLLLMATAAGCGAPPGSDEPAAATAAITEATAPVTPARHREPAVAPGAPTPRIAADPANSDPMPADGQHDGVDNTGTPAAPAGDTPTMPGGTTTGTGGGGKTSSDPMPATGK